MGGMMRLGRNQSLAGSTEGSAARLESQLAEVAGECVGRQTCFQVDQPAGKVLASAVFSWRDKDFSAAYADAARPVFTSRSPIERAVLAFVQPRLLAAESEYLEKNMFQVAFRPFDWRLNDLTGRGGR